MLLLRFHQRYEYPNDARADEDVLEYNHTHFAPLYIIIGLGAATRLLAFVVLYCSNRGEMGQPPLFKKKVKEERQKTMSPNEISIELTSKAVDSCTV